MNTPRLIECVKSGDLQSVLLLLKSEIDVNQTDVHGWTALHWAAGAGNVELVSLLLENGADVLATTPEHSI